jgi:hypothetical protein
MSDNVIALPTQATTVQELLPTLRLLIEQVAKLTAEIEELKNGA